MTALYQVSHLLAVGICVFIWGYTYSQRRDDPVNKAFRLYVANNLGWTLLEFVYYSPYSIGYERMLQRAISFFWIPIGFWFFNFVYALLKRKRDVLYWLTAASVLAGLFLDNFTDLGTLGWIRHEWGVANVRGPLHTSVLTNLAAVPCVVGLALLVRAYFKRTVPGMRKPIKLMIIGGVLVFCIIWLMNVYIPNILGFEDFPRMGSAATSLFLLFVMVMIFKYDFVSINPADVAVDLFQGARDGLIIFDRNERIVRANPAAVKMLAGLGDRIGEPLDQVLPWHGLPSEFEELEVELDARGDRRYFRLSKSWSTEGGGNKAGVLVIHDVSKQVKARKRLKLSAEQAEAEIAARTNELKRAQQLEAVGILAGTVVHDFNNIIFAIMGQVEVACDSIPEHSLAQKELERVRQAIDKCSDVGKEILGFSRKSKSKEVEFDITGVLARVHRILQASVPSSVKLEVALPEPGMKVKADPAKVQQAVVNICTNSFQAMPDGRGTITMRADLFDVDEVFSASRPPLKPGRHVRISVTDDGCGMSRDEAARAFEPFFTTKDGASGLGLPTALRIVQAARGTIWIESTQGVGTKVEVLLPLAG